MILYLYTLQLVDEDHYFYFRTYFCLVDVASTRPIHVLAGRTKLFSEALLRRVTIDTCTE